MTDTARTDGAVATLRALIDRIPDSTHATCDKDVLRTVLDALADTQRYAERLKAYGDLKRQMDSAAFAAMRTQITELEAECDEQRARAEAAEKRVAELEARNRKADQ